MRTASEAEFDKPFIEGKLTPVAVRNARKPGLYGDGHGLYLQVSRFETKAWIFRYMIEGRARKMGLGSIATVSITKARQFAAAARLGIREGVDPLDARKSALAQKKVEAAKAITFKECAEKYIAANETAWSNKKHRAQWAATFNPTKRGTLSFPASTEAINGLPVAAIDTGLVLKVLEPIWSKTPETASRVRGRIESVLSWATVRQYRTGDNPARWRGHLDEVLPQPSKVRKVEHHIAVPYDKLPAFAASLRVKDSVSARALEFTILTAARTGETVGAKWSEFDLKARLWTIPGARMKAAREHRVPLSARAIKILNALPRDGEFVFAGAKAGRPISNWAMLQLLRGMLGMGATVHGFRSSFRDWCAETTAYPSEMCEFALAHAVSDKTEAAYRRGDMMEKRRRLMDDWAAYCERDAARNPKVVLIREHA
jgi:integrase